MSSLPQSSGFTGRFMVVYLVLGVVLVSAVTGVIVLAMKPAPPAPPAWSTWRPAAGSSSKLTGEIISHVAHQYKLNAKGEPLVVIFPSAPEVNQNVKNFDVSTIGILSTPTSQTVSRVVATTGIIQQQYCGLGAACAISRGTASSARERLVRREALEIALYTFKFVPSVNGVLAFMPPPPGSPPESVLFLERSGLSKQLREPIAKTLPLLKPPLPSEADPKESDTIDRLTLPVEYGFQYQELDNKTQAVILRPSS